MVSRSPPEADIIQSVEPALRHLNKTAADDARLHISQALKNHKPIKPNISKTEQQAINSLRRDHSIHILTADKRNATVVMDKADYDRKVRDILESGAYRLLNKNPIPSIQKRFQAKLLALQRSDSISMALYRQLRPSSS